MLEECFMFYKLCSLVLCFSLFNAASSYAIHFSKPEKDPENEAYFQTLKKFNEEKSPTKRAEAFLELGAFDPSYVHIRGLHSISTQDVKDLDETATREERAMIACAELIDMGEDEWSTLFPLIKATLSDKDKKAVIDYCNSSAFYSKRQKDLFVDSAYKLLKKVKSWDAVTVLLAMSTHKFLINSAGSFHSRESHQDRMVLDNLYKEYPSARLASYYLMTYVIPIQNNLTPVLLKKAIDLIEKILTDPDQTSDYTDLPDLYMYYLLKDMQYAKLEAFAQIEAQNKPDSYFAWLYLGDCFEEKDDSHRAIEYFSKALPLAEGKNKREVLRTISYHLKKTGQLDKSKEILVQLQEEGLKKQLEIATKRAKERKGLAEVIRIQQMTTAAAKESTKAETSTRKPSSPQQPAKTQDTQTAMESYDSKQENMASYYKKQAESQKEKIKSHKGNNNADLPQPNSPPEESDEDEPISLDVKSIIGANGAFKTFNKMFDLYRQGERVTDITNKELGTLLEQLHAEPKNESKHERTVDKKQGKGSHTKVTLNRGQALDEDAPEEMLILTKRNGEYVHPQAIEDLCYLFVKYGLYPDDVKDHLKTRWPELFLKK